MFKCQKIHMHFINSKLSFFSTNDEKTSKDHKPYKVFLKMIVKFEVTTFIAEIFVRLV